jgi:hypothetical protein
VIFTVLPEAQSEVDLAAAWYDAQSLGLGDGFLDELHRAYGVIRRQPLSFARVARAAQGASFVSTSSDILHIQ